ncbi:MAG: RIP metalloprotease RseP [Candidatus Omnitrophica bacterium]|nr:RIP metalloprotease RseP [Candidatus Omnitrophota bacterium]
MSLLIFLLVLGILIIVHEFGHFIAAKKVGVKVEKFSLGFGPRLLKKKVNHTEYTINAIPLGGYVKLAGDNLEEYKGKSDEYFSKSPGKRFQIVFFGPMLNYVMGFLVLWSIFFIGYPTFTTKIGGLLEDYGAKAAGLQIEDRILAVDGQEVYYWEDLQEIILNKKSESVKLSILRDNQEFSLDVVIKEKEFQDPLGTKLSVGLLGIEPFDEFVSIRHGFFESFLLAVNKTWAFTEITYRSLWRMITGKLSFKDSVAGPLRIFKITSDAANMGIIALMHLIAILNISLAIFNLLPIPVLDGGHILFLAIERLRGKALGIKAERIVTQIGMTVILSLIIFVTYNDFVNVFGDKISGFFN